jgi:hypothetical protein
MCNAASNGEPLAAIEAAVEGLRSRSRGGWSPEQLGQELIRIRHVADLLEVEFSAIAADFAATEEYERHGSVSPVDWIRHECRMSARAATDAVSVGEQADALPASVEAVTEGRIGFAHLALLAGCAGAIRASATGGGFDEAPLLARALEHSVSRFRHDCAHARHAADAREFLREQVDAVEARSLELLRCDGGAVVVRGFLDAVGGATLRTALEPLARRAGADDGRLRDRRLADALVELAAHHLGNACASGRPGQSAHLQVTASLETVRGLMGASAGELGFAGPIPAATVQRLACDANIARVVLGSDSAVLDVGRARRLPSGATRRALQVRDRGCAWPGCDRPPSWTAAHHLHHWAHGGATDLSNLVLLCHRHHWLIHEGGWQLVREQDGALATIPPIPEYLQSARAPDHSAAA